MIVARSVYVHCVQQELLFANSHCLHQQGDGGEGEQENICIYKTTHPCMIYYGRHSEYELDELTYDQD